MNELQNSLLLLLQSFIEVCDKLDLTYYLANGSALGAEKYGGFIPWDDDIDVAMPREDYDIFCSRAQDILPEHIFVQNFRTERNFPLIYTKLRNSETTFIEEDVKNIEMNHGIYLDIFPLDGYPKRSLQRGLLRCKMKVLVCKQFCGFNNSNKLHKKVFRLLGYHKKTEKTVEKIEKLIKGFGNNTKFCCDYGDRQGKGCLPRAYYGTGRRACFEQISVNLPEKIDEYLSYKYGEWKEDLPLEEQASHHRVAKYDLSKSYKYYVDKL